MRELFSATMNFDNIPSKSWIVGKTSLDNTEANLRQSASATFVCDALKNDSVPSPTLGVSFSHHSQLFHSRSLLLKGSILPEGALYIYVILRYYWSIMSDEHSKYTAYLQSHPLALDICYLVGRAASRGLSAKEASVFLGRAIQTTSSSLRELEDIGILQSEKTVLERRFTAKDPRVFKEALRQAASLTPTKTVFKGRILPTQILFDHLAKELSARAHAAKVTVARGVSPDIPFAKLVADYVVTDSRGYNHLIGIKHITNEVSFERVLGWFFTLLMLRDDMPNMGLIVLVAILDTRQLKAILDSHQLNMWSLEKLVAGKYGSKAAVILEQANDITLMAPEFAGKLANEIWDVLSLKISSGVKQRQ